MFFRKTVMFTSNVTVTWRKTNALMLYGIFEDFMCCCCLWRLITLVSIFVQSMTKRVRYSNWGFVSPDKLLGINWWWKQWLHTMVTPGMTRPKPLPPQCPFHPIKLNVNSNKNRPRGGDCSQASNGRRRHSAGGKRLDEACNFKQYLFNVYFDSRILQYG